MKGGVSEENREALLSFGFSDDQINNILTKHSTLPLSIFRNAVQQQTPEQIMESLEQPMEEDEVVPAADEMPFENEEIHRTGGNKKSKKNKRSKKRI